MSSRFKKKKKRGLNSSKNSVTKRSTFKTSSDNNSKAEFNNELNNISKDNDNLLNSLVNSKQESFQIKDKKEINTDLLITEPVIGGKK